ncbi:hypothetical protein XCR_0799 [Xanthomonas campestris pv. raphani 756C]|nr:hypothetical protein XCR_0799 [Xanthomonas campestris pv. raphani 756C]
MRFSMEPDDGWQQHAHHLGARTVFHKDFNMHTYFVSK